MDNDEAVSKLHGAGAGRVLLMSIFDRDALGLL